MLLKFYTVIEIQVEEDQFEPNQNKAEQLAKLRFDAKDRISTILYNENDYREALSVDYMFTSVEHFDTLQGLNNAHLLPEVVAGAAG